MPFLTPLLVGRVPTKMEYRNTAATLILTSLLEDLVLIGVGGPSKSGLIPR